MKIIKLKGGLGNQMFQYSYAKLIEKLSGEEVRLDYSAFQTLKGDSVRVPRLAKFNLTLEAATNDDIRKVCLFKHKGNSLSYRYKLGIFLESKINKKYFLEPNRAYILPESIINHEYFDGYWQSWRYVDIVQDEILGDFTPGYELSLQTNLTKEVMQGQDSVFVGVRRGDYAEEKSHYGSFGAEYYLRAMKTIEEHVTNPVYYIFSNDIPWCKTNLDWGGRTVIYREKEQQTDDFEELMLMASCKHAIIINSSYHWWGATLISNSNKMVCCPAKWWFDDAPIDIIPENWSRIKV